MAGIGGDGLSGGTPGKQPQKNAQVFSFGDDLFNAHTGYVYIGKVCAHIRIPFVGTDYKFPGFGNGKVYACNGCFTG
ncbi:hypothetical protein D3C87_1764660 [compost metagenome]